MHKPAIAVICSLPLARAAAAYETDQLTDRDQPLADAAPALDAWTTRKLVDIAADVNAATRCEGSDARMQARLARAIHERLASKVHLDEHGLVRGLGYDQIMAFLEENPTVERRSFHDRDDIYALAKPTEAPILAVVGPCSTVQLAGVRMGTDKPSHFVDVGYDYYRHSHKGRRPDRAVAWGTETERTFYGKATSSAFSFADLRANYDGYRFYAGLLGPDSPLQRDEDGCVELVSPFRWERWVDWEYDELQNPNTYTEGARKALLRRLADPAPALCAIADTLGPDFDAHLVQALTEPRPYVTDKAPPRSDPFRLKERCADATARPDLADTTSGTPAPPPTAVSPP